MKELKDEELKELKLKLEKEIKNLHKYVEPAKLSIKELEKVEPLDEKKLENLKAEIKLLESEIKERQDNIDLVDKEVELRVKIREMIDNSGVKDLDFEDEDVHSFLHRFEFCDHIEIKEELRVDGILQLNDEGLPIEVVKEVKHIPWDKEAVLKDLKLKLDLDKANDLVRLVKDYKHNKKKDELENRLIPLIHNNINFLEAFGEEVVVVKGERFAVHHNDRIAKWNKDNLIDFEEKILKLELAKKHIDEKEKKEKPIKDRKLAYHQIDDLLFEALVEKHEEDRPEKMVEYLKLRKEIKDKYPLED